MTKTEFVHKVAERLGTVDMSEAESASRSVLAALSDRITDDEAKDLASQLPREFATFIRGRTGPVQKMDMETFIRRIQSDLDLETSEQAKNVARGVFSVVKEAVSEGEWTDVVSQMPRELQEMFVTA